MIDERIVEFIKSQHVLTLATNGDDGAYCSSAFYSYMPEENSLVFSAAASTKHAVDMLKNNNVAGTIALQTKIIGKIQGVQFCGTAFPVFEGDDRYESARKSYVKKFPYTAIMSLDLWVIDLNFIKFTDNTLGFGKKLTWQK